MNIANFVGKKSSRRWRDFAPKMKNIGYVRHVLRISKILSTGHCFKGENRYSSRSLASFLLENEIFRHVKRTAALLRFFFLHYLRLFKTDIVDPEFAGNIVERVNTNSRDRTGPILVRRQIERIVNKLAVRRLFKFSTEGSAFGKSACA